MTAADRTLIDRAAAYGDGVFETIAIRAGKPRYWNAHVRRLQTDCARLAIDCPSLKQLEQRMHDVIQAASIPTDFATARLVVAASDSPRGYRRNASGRAKLGIELFAATPIDPQLVSSGVTTRICSVRLGIQPMLAGIKSLNRLEQVLARNEWQEPEIFEGIMLDLDGRLICGTMSNVFLVNNSKLVTPAITRCGVSGIMRARTIQLLRDAGTDCTVRDVDAAELRDATEIFLSNSQFGVLPVHAIDAQRFRVGPITRKAQAVLVADGVTECSA